MPGRRRLKIVHVLHHSLSGEMIGKDNYVDEAGWHVRTAVEIRKRNRDYDIECWAPEKTLKQPRIYELGGMVCRHFPSHPIPGLPAREVCPRLVRELRKEATAGPLLVHLHGIYNPVTYHVALALGNVPKLAQGHGDNPGTVNLRLGLQSRDWRIVLGVLPVAAAEAIPLHLALRRIDHFYVLNNLEFNAVSGIVGPGKVEMQTMGIDFDLFRPREKSEARRLLNIGPDSQCVLYVGALRRGKGVDKLLCAFSEVLKTHRDSMLLVAGDGKQKRRLQELSRMQGIENRVRFLGWIDNRRLPFVYSAANVCVLPSLYEGLGMTVVEALACGTQFVGSSVGGIPDVVRNFESGTLVPPRDVAALSRALLRSLGPEEQPGPNREKAEKVYGWPHIADRTIEMYNALNNKYYGSNFL